MCADFALPIKMSLSQPTSFLAFTLPILYTIALGKSELVAGGALLPAEVKPWQLDS